jgi:hypothetical protein
MLVGAAAYIIEHPHKVYVQNVDIMHPKKRSIPPSRAPSVSFGHFLRELSSKRCVHRLQNRFFSFGPSNESRERDPCALLVHATCLLPEVVHPLDLWALVMINLSGCLYSVVHQISLSHSISSYHSHVVGRLGACYVIWWCIPLHLISHDFLSTHLSYSLRDRTSKTLQSRSPDMKTDAAA